MRQCFEVMELVRILITYTHTKESTVLLVSLKKKKKPVTLFEGLGGFSLLFI